MISNTKKYKFGLPYIKKAIIISIFLYKELLAISIFKMLII